MCDTMIMRFFDAIIYHLSMAAVRVGFGFALVFAYFQLFFWVAVVVGVGYLIARLFF